MYQNISAVALVTLLRNTIGMTKKKLAPTPDRTLVLFLLALFALTGLKMNRDYRKTRATPSTEMVSQKVLPFDFANQTFNLDGKSLHFVGGQYEDSELQASISAKTVNPSGTKAAALLVENPGGSGVFFSLIGASMKDTREIYSSPVLLGDRIQLETLSVDDEGIITVEYLDRSPNAPMVTPPTVKMTKKFAFQDDGNLIVVLH